MSENKELIIGSSDQLLQMTTRRRFLGILGVAGSVVFLPSVFAACNDNSDITNPDPSLYRLDLSTDAGILNYAYALEQLEAAFYTYVLASAAGYGGLSADEKEVMQDVQRHEVIHREFFKQVLGTAAIPALGFDTTVIGDLTATAASLLSTSQLLEDTGVSAYNGAGKYLTDANNLLVAGKIVSVEARHAAAFRDIRDIRASNTGKLFAGNDVVSTAAPAGLDVKAEPSTVLASVANLKVITSPLVQGVAPKGSPSADQPAPTPT
jgi:hypothetical protein